MAKKKKAKKVSPSEDGLDRVTMTLGITIPGMKQFSGGRVDLGAEASVTKSFEDTVYLLRDKIWGELEDLAPAWSEFVDETVKTIDKNRRRRR